jgi:hypothetical protein
MGEFMKTGKKIIIACVIILVFGCATLSEPKSESDKLVTGIIIQKGEGFQNYSGASVNGIHKTGIEMTIKNISTNEEYKVKTRKNGLFYIYELPEGIYEIDNFYLKVTSGNAWADTHSSPNDSLKFSVVNGKVNNLGVINWDGKMRGGTNFTFSQLYNDVINEFNAQFPKSAWLDHEVINTNIIKN